MSKPADLVQGTVDLLILKTVALRPGMSANVTRMDERNINGIPTKFAAAIIDDSRRINSAIPCEKPANTAQRSAAQYHPTTTRDATRR